MRPADVRLGGLRPGGVRLCKALVLLWFACGLGIGPAARAGVPSVYLVQNSGWMEPYYVEPAAPQFRALLARLIAVSQDDAGVVVADFNQDGQLADRHSPHVIYQGAYDGPRIQEKLNQLDLPRQRNGHLTDADFNGALVHAVTDVLGNRSGIIWLVTNNKNSPNNSSQVNQNTRDFALRLSNTAALADIVAYPIRMPAHSSAHDEKGLIIYGIAYGDEAAAALRAKVHAPGLTQMFPDPAMQLKPLDRASVVFTPAGTSTAGVAASRAQDGTVVVSGVPGEQASTVEITGSLTSQYYPQVIEAAQLTAGWRSLDGAPMPDQADGLPGSVDPPEVHGLGPGGTLQGVRIRLAVPGVPRQGGVAGLFQKEVVLDGVVAIGLTGLHLGLQEGFADKMAQIAALDQLPSVFSSYQAVTAAETTMPVRLVVRFSPVPLILAISASALALLALAAAAVMVRRDREHVLAIGGQTRRVRVRPFETRQVSSADGRLFKVRGTVFGRARVAAVSQTGAGARKP